MGRTVRCNDRDIEYEAGSRHRKLVLEHFGFDERSIGTSANGTPEKYEEGDANDVKLSPKKRPASEKSQPD